MLLCGWLPPTLVTACGLITALGWLVHHCCFPVLAQLLPVGTPSVAFWLALTTAMLLFRKCVWVGSVCMFIVTAVEPAASPNVCPLPIWIGTWPRKLGSAKLVCPLPPYVVPSNANKAWF